MNPEVQVDADLAERAAELAAVRGETVEEIVARALREYVTAEVDAPPA